MTPGTKLPDGHRIFRAAEPFSQAMHGYLPPSLQRCPDGGVWATADNSGGFPHTTDDGILWLDFSRDLNAGPSGGSPGIPLLDKHGKECSTVTDTATLFELSAHFQWDINVLGKIHRVIEV
jgi:hypothetical protein